MNLKALRLLHLAPLLYPSSSSAAPAPQPKSRNPSPHGATTAAYHAGAGVLRHVNPLIGTWGASPNGNGGMIPSVSPPFGATRWTPQTRENFISQVPYSDGDGRLHGLQATHQPAIWMGEQGQVVLVPGTGAVEPLFERRGLAFRKADEGASPYVYEVLLDADSGGVAGWNLTEEAAAEMLGGGCPPCLGGAGSVPDSVVEGANGRVRRRDALPRPGVYERMAASESESESESETGDGRSDAEGYERAIRVALTASGHVGHLRLDFEDNTGCAQEERQQPHVFVQASRVNWTGHVEVDLENREISGSNTQRQDYLLGPDKAESFRGYFVSRFSAPFTSFGVSQGGKIRNGTRRIEGEHVGAYAYFDQSTERVEVRTGVSFISVEQARRNVEVEIPDGTTFETTVEEVKAAWLDKLGRISVSGVNETDGDHDPLAIFYTGLFHALQYPSDFSEPTTRAAGGTRRFYSGYTDSVHEADDAYYQSWSIWDTYRAEHSLLTLLAPERVDGMMRSLLRIFGWSGRLPIWANVVETNVMIATNADAVLANALARGFGGFDRREAWAAVRRDAYEPPERDDELLYFDREPRTPHEARAGLSAYLARGWVANDGWAESASRTLDYAFNDHAAAAVAAAAGEAAAAAELRRRAGNYAAVWNAEAQFMQARNANGSWANETWGWTEGDRWVYTFDVMHDVAGLAGLFDGGREALLARLDAHFAGGHNLHSNEPAHHVPYLYAALGRPAATADRVRAIAWEDYNATAGGLSGNEDLGQMSAWYVFSALGFYPVNPASDEYVVGSPFFDEVSLRLPAGPATGGGAEEEKVLVIRAEGAATTKPYVKALTVDGRKVERPLLRHGEIVAAKIIEFEMSESPTDWGSRGTI